MQFINQPQKEIMKLPLIFWTRFRRFDFKKLEYLQTCVSLSEKNPLELDLLSSKKRGCLFDLI